MRGDKAANIKVSFGEGVLRRGGEIFPIPGREKEKEI